jgi:DNA invertase Pin-like site-specific DNA recombinase
MKAVIYCRVSSKEQVDGTSLESQELACREYAARNQGEVAKVFVERGESAKFADRTQLLELLAFCRNRGNAIDCMLVWKVDRLARNVGDHFSIKATLLRQNIRVVSVTEPIDAKPEGKLLETILAGFAQFDNDVRAARTVQGQRRKIQEGLAPWRAPLGYRTATLGHKKTEPDRPEQPTFRILQRAWNDFASGQFTQADILRQVTKQGLRTAAGKTLSKQTLANILTDPFYAGTLRDPWSGEEVTGRHLAMVSQAIFAKVQTILGRSGHAVPHKELRPEFPLRAFVRCSNCESHLTGSFSRGRSKRYPYYRCFNRNCDSGAHYPSVQVHKEFRGFLSDTSSNRLSLKRLKQTIQRIAETWSDSSQILAEKRALEITRTKDQQQQLIRMKMDQLINDEEFVAQRSDLMSRLAELEAHEIERDIDSDAVLQNIDSICSPLEDLGAAWLGLPIELQRRFQMIALPEGYVLGRVGTALRGRLFTLLGASGTSKSSLVPPTGLCWNQLAEEIEAFATIIRETSGGIREEVPS